MGGHVNIENITDELSFPREAGTSVRDGGQNAQGAEFSVGERRRVLLGF